MENSVTLTGTLGGDPVRRTTTKGELTTFSLAHTPRIRGEQGWVDGQTSWFEVAVWGALGRNVLTSLRKGQRAIVHGAVSINEWTNEEGVKSRTTQIRATLVGHDLTFGTTQFTRSTPQRVVSEPQQEHRAPAVDQGEPRTEQLVLQAAAAPPRANEWGSSLGADDDTPF